jgi:succinoglycan biosynthesis transport protein ExoP
MSNQFPNSLPVSPGSPPGPVQPPPSSSDMYYELEKGHTIREYINILLSRKWWVIGTFLTIVFLAGLYTYTRTPIYRASETIEITADNPGSQVSADGRMSMMGSWFYAQKFQETQNKILKSHSLAKRIIKALNLESHPDFVGIAKSKNKSPEAILESMASSFVGRLNIEPIRNTYLVEVSYQSPDKLITKKVLDILANEYLFLLIDRRNQSFALVRKWLNNQLNEMAEKVQETQKKLYKFGQKTDIYMIGNKNGDQENVIVQKFVDLSALLTKAQNEEMAKKAQYQQIKQQGPNASLIVNNPLIAALRQELVVQQSKVSSMGKIYLPGHPEMQAETAKLSELKSRLGAEVKRIEESVKADYEAAERTERLLQDSFTNQKQQMANLQDNLSNYQILKRDAQTNEQLYQALLSRVKEVNISSTMVSSNVSVIDPAVEPSSPFKPKKFQNMALASLLGLVLGVALALLVDALDDTIKSTEDLEKQCNLPLLGTLPSLNSYRKLMRGAVKKKNLLDWRSYVPGFRRDDHELPEAGDLDLVVYKHPQDPISEALRHMETSIMLSVSGRPPGVIMVTSPNPSEGKTMVASNLAQSLALHGHPTVMIDCDLRKPRAHRIFDLEAQPGLTNFLTGGATREEILRTTAIPDLTVIPAGPQSPSPSNLLNSEVFKDFLVQLRQQFSHIIIDTPPILGFSDARIISVLVDGAILVTRFNSTHKNAARLAVQLLGQINAPLMGGVLNGIETSSGKYGAYQYYNYKLYSKYYRVDD